jgi:hypothetical protein
MAQQQALTVQGLIDALEKAKQTVGAAAPVLMPDNLPVVRIHALEADGAVYVSDLSNDEDLADAADEQKQILDAFGH